MNKQGPNGIAWCDYTWNPIVGCSPASEGCANCYAAQISKRFQLPWGSAHFLPERLDEPEKVKNPSRVFACSMADLGHETVRKCCRAEVQAAMQRAPWHTYIVLTKRPGPWMEAFARIGCWLGVTAENQERYNERWGALKDIPARVRFVSVEPMLGPVTTHVNAHQRPDWVIAGPETGPGARPCRREWIDALAGESPFFFDKRKPADCMMRREWPA